MILAVAGLLGPVQHDTDQIDHSRQHWGLAKDNQLKQRPQNRFPLDTKVLRRVPQPKSI